MSNVNENSRSESFTKLCKKWLELIAFLHIIGGLSLSFNWPSVIWYEYQQRLLELFSIGSEVGTGVSVGARFESIMSMLIQLFGPTIASWGILMFYLIRRINIDSLSSDENKNNINILLLATSVWFVLDTTISLNFGVMLHAVINMLAALSILLPLVYLRFRKGE